jgi:Metallopeptidase toxin 4
MRPDIVNKALKANEAAGVSAASKTIYLREGATYHELFHEYLHWRQWVQNPGAYNAMSALEREMYVFYHIRNSKFWDLMTLEQQMLAVRQLTERGGGSAGWQNWAFPGYK